MDSGDAVVLRARLCSSERDGRVLVLQAVILELLEPYNTLLTNLQLTLVWKRPLRSVLLHSAVNVVFWFFALTSLRLLCLLCASLALAVCLDVGRNWICPSIRFKQADENERWDLTHPGILSVSKLSQYMAETLLTVTSFIRSLMHFKLQYPGMFCLLVCGFLSFLAMMGHYIPGLVLSYSAVLAMLLCPLAMYHRLLQRLWVQLEPTEKWLDFSTHGYMMSKLKENQFLSRPVRHTASADTSDSEEELSAFCPELDDSAVTKDLAITDSEHSDAEGSCADNGAFSVSRGQTPLTEGSEDYERHSDPEESFVCNLLDFPCISPGARLLDDNLSPSGGLSCSRLDQDTELSLSRSSTADLTAKITSMIASSMIYAVLEGSMQPQDTASPHKDDPSHVHRGYRKHSSSDLDSGPDGEEYEMLDQLELQ